MSAQEITPRLAVALRSLAQCQLQAQASRSITLTAGAIGVMSVDAAIAATVIAAIPDDNFQGAVLALLSVSFGLAVRAALFKGGERIGPLVAEVLYNRTKLADSELEERLIEDLAADMIVNRLVIARKAPLLSGAVASMASAIIFELLGLVF